MNKPDTSENELYELCKEVYEKTGWEAPETYKAEDGNPENDWQAYDTDYLLEKLQSWFCDMGANDFGQFYVTMLAYGFIAKVRSHDEDFSEQVSADTPLKALLKLTIALSEAGELNDQSS